MSGPLQIKFLFSYPKKFRLTSWLIKTIDRASFSHVAIEVPDTQTNQVMLFEASHGEAHWTIKDEWLKHNDVKFSITLPISWKQYILIKTMFNEWSDRTKYGFLGVLGILVAMIFKLHINIFRDKDKTLFCSEIAGYVLKEVFGLPLKRIELLSPNDVKKITLKAKLKGEL